MAIENLKHCPAGSGWQWLVEGFGLFKRAPGIWILILLCWGVLQILLSSVPVLGGLILVLISPVLTGGILFGCRDLERGQALKIGHLLSGFQSERAGSLVMLGLATMGLYFVAIALVAAIVTVFVVGLGGSDLDPEALVSGPAGLLVVMLSVLVFVPVMMAAWFAPALVALRETGVVDALKASFHGCMANLGALTVYGLAAILLSIIAMIPLGLGLLVFIPVAMAANYRAYRAIFPTEDPETDGAEPMVSIIE